MKELEAIGRMINRSVLVVRPRQPFCDWVNSTVPDDDETFTLEALSEDPTAFLVPSIEEDGDLEKVLRKYHKDIFEHELSGWYNDETRWPKRRGVATFREWFDISVQSVVIDLCDFELSQEDW